MERVEVFWAQETGLIFDRILIAICTHSRGSLNFVVPIHRFSGSFLLLELHCAPDTRSATFITNATWRMFFLSSHLSLRILSEEGFNRCIGCSSWAFFAFKCEVWWWMSRCWAEFAFGRARSWRLLIRGMSLFHQSCDHVHCELFVALQFFL